MRHIQTFVSHVIAYYISPNNVNEVSTLLGSEESMQYKAIIYKLQIPVLLGSFFALWVLGIFPIRTTSSSSASLRSRRLVRAGEERASLNERLPKCL